MKKMLILLVIMAATVIPCYAPAAQNTTFSSSSLFDDVTIISIAFESDASGAILDASTNVTGGYVFQVTTIPGSPAPSMNWDAVLNDGDSVDIAGGELANRDASSNQQIMPKLGNGYSERFVTGTLTISISGNVIAGAKGTIKVYLRRRAK